ncbi:MAG: hypothetical protein HY683_06070 [Chloroflexi bacterium]|nr:hypothetical protein [Chloroflexota bacterium]
MTQDHNATQAGLPPEASSGSQVIQGLREALEQGQPWSLALLTAMGQWTVAEEDYRGRRYRYLIAGEAFDWPALVHRLLHEVDGLVPARQGTQVLRPGHLFKGTSNALLQELLGPDKHRAFLNFWYGVVVERSLQRAVTAEVQKEWMSRGLVARADVTNEAFLRVYGESCEPLVARYLAEHHHDGAAGLPPEERKPFLYWLSKLRVLCCEKARLASDTRKGLEWLLRHPEWWRDPWLA